ncbi:hypothetical protein R3P38DRAFT_3189362 [Favolaschia claudopus]|uniref:Uncharacterized protein n=1 Tax=Favolaschia claudopus TaxID=2862362 RepID=A0AAW0BUM6_9AGAR
MFILTSRPLNLDRVVPISPVASSGSIQDIASEMKTLAIRWTFPNSERGARRPYLRASSDIGVLPRRVTAKLKHFGVLAQTRALFAAADSGECIPTSRRHHHVYPAAQLMPGIGSPLRSDKSMMHFGIFLNC